MLKLQSIPTKELRKMRKRYTSAIYADYRAQVELELIRRAELANWYIGWITLGLIVVGLWVLLGSTFNLMEVPH